MILTEEEFIAISEELEKEVKAFLKKKGYKVIHWQCFYGRRATNFLEGEFWAKEM